MIVTRAAALIGLGLGAGSMMSSSKGTSHPVPPAVIQEASSSISPFLIVAIALLVGARAGTSWAFETQDR